MDEVLNKLSLSCYDCNQAENLFELTNRNRTWLRRWLDWIDKVQTTKDSLNFIERQMVSNLPGYFICYDGKMIGLVGLVSVNVHSRSGEIGYWIDENMQGKGIATWAVENLISRLVEDDFLEVLFIKCIPKNIGSKRVAEKCGFHYVSTVKDGIILLGDSYDLLVYQRFMR